MAEFLIWANADKPFRNRGDITEVRANDSFYGSAETLPDYCVIKVPPFMLAEVDQYAVAWNVEIDYEQLDNTPGADSFRYRIFSITNNVSGIGGITRESIETFMSSWGAAVVSVAPNEVVIDFTIYNLATSVRFWKQARAALVIFTELDYSVGSGVHIIQADYNALLNNPTYVERTISWQADIIAHAGKVLTFEVNRNTVLQEFKREVAEKARQVLHGKSRFYFGGLVVDSVVAAGGILVATSTDFNSYVKDKLDD